MTQMDNDMKMTKLKNMCENIMCMMENNIIRVENDIIKNIMLSQENDIIWEMII